MVENRTERLVTVISLNQDALFRYIFSLLPHNEDARDVLQETLMAITAQFDEYDPSRPFLPWACRFAYFKVMQHRDKSPRHVRFFAAEVMELLTHDRDAQAHLLESRLAALDECMDKLPPADRELLAGRYFVKRPLNDLAVQVKQSRRTLLRNLQRLRRWLNECVANHAVSEDLQ